MNITFIGGGNMASAIIGGLKAKLGGTATIRVAEPHAAARTRLETDFGVACFESAAAAAPFAVGELVVMAVKPQNMREAALALAPHLKPGQMVLSVAAGTRLGDLERWLGGHKLLSRCMPNTPALIGSGISGLYARPEATAEQRALIEGVLGAVGSVIWVADEALLDPVTAVSASGPAYVFYFIEALRDAATELGLDAAAANRLAIETFLGAARLAAQSTEDVALLRERVTSKGGTTAAALHVMQLENVKAHIVKAVEAASARATQMGVELGKD
jgi:pyrroline-5-carboxylate reductase